MWSGRPISGPRSTRLEQGRAAVVPAAALVSETHQSKESHSSATAALVPGSSINLLNSCQITPIFPLTKEACRVSDTEKPLKKIPFPSYLFTPLSALPHATLMPFIRRKGADIQDSSTL